MASEITISEYRYEEIYPSFKAQTDEKYLTAALNARFLRGLISRQFLGPREPLLLADLGCGPCDTILMYLGDVRYPPGFRIRATDFSADYADPERGQARQALAQAQRSRRPAIVDFSVAQGDSFAGELLRLTAPRDGAPAPKSFDLVFASHMLYHCPSVAALGVMMADVSGNLLKRQGIFMLYHAVAAPRTFVYLRAKFGRHGASLEQSDTPAPNLGDPARCVSDYCAAQGLPCLELNFTARMHLPGLRDAHWEGFRHPEQYARLAAEQSAAAENLKRLLFITQRAPLEFAADRSELGLNAYLAESRAIIEANHGEMPLAERLQVVCHPDLPQAFVEGVREALAAAAQ